MIRHMRQAALDSRGFVTDHTGHRLNVTGLWRKHAYVAPVDGEWFVGSGRISSNQKDWGARGRVVRHHAIAFV